MGVVAEADGGVSALSLITTPLRPASMLDHRIQGLDDANAAYMYLSAYPPKP